MSENTVEYSIDGKSMSDDEIIGYMKRIGIDSNITVDLNSLVSLQKAHLTHIPYENYDSLEHKLTSLNHKELYRKLITAHRGGICFELNGLYAWLLKSIGFDVKSHLSRYIIPEGEVHQRTHRVMTVTIDNKRYLTDVGVNSECSRKPLLLAQEVVQNDGISEYRLEKDDFFGWILWQKLKNKEWHRLYGFTEEPQLDIDFIMPCTFCDIHPLSGINKFEKVSLFTDHSNIRIWDGHFQEFSSGKIEKDEIISTDEKENILHNLFGL